MSITHNGLVYSVNNNGYLGVGTGSDEFGNGAVSKTKISGKIKIPKYVEGKLVKYINDYAFRECRLIESVKIDAHLISIGHAAFYNCVLLDSITLPRTIEFVDRFVFSMPARSGKFTVIFEYPTKLNKIGINCFECNSAGITIFLPKTTLPKIGNNVLYKTVNATIYMSQKGLNFSGVYTKHYEHSCLDPFCTIRYRRKLNASLLLLLIVIVC